MNTIVKHPYLLSFLWCCFTIALFGCSGNSNDDIVNVPVKSVTLSKTSIDMVEGEETTLTATINPQIATHPEVAWTSSDSQIATVVKGTITALKAGSATITATADQVSATCQVTVRTKQVETDTWEDAQTAVANMRMGWNLGNTLESCLSGWSEATTNHTVYEYETLWGQPVTTREMIHMFKVKGFNAIRVPVTWWPHITPNSPYTISEAWMNRVEEVVNYVLDEGMYCILNIHHDSGDGQDAWLRADLSKYEQINDKFVKIWEQLAKRFEKYDGKLLFEDFNEILDSKGNWNAPEDASSYTAVNRLAQSFVNTVRATGGNNAKRILVVNTYCAGNEAGPVDNFVVPTDQVANRIIVEVHSYNPWAWDDLNNPWTVGDPDRGKWQPKHIAEIEKMYERLNKAFLQKGWPVIIGEFAALNCALTTEGQAEAAKYTTTVVGLGKKYGIVCFHWMGLLDRQNLVWSQPAVIDAMLKATE